MRRDKKNRGLSFGCCFLCEQQTFGQKFTFERSRLGLRNQIYQIKFWWFIPSKDRNQESSLVGINILNSHLCAFYCLHHLFNSVSFRVYILFIIALISEKNNIIVITVIDWPGFLEEEYHTYYVILFQLLQLMS